MHYRILVAVLSLTVAGLSHRAHGQGPRGAAVEATLGIGSELGGTYDTRAGLAFDVLASNWAPWTGRRLIAGLAVANQNPIDGSDDCLLPKGGGGCVPNFPSLTSIGMLVGFAVRNPGEASARLLAGPGYFWGGGRGAGGIQGRLDLTSPAVGPISLIASGRASLLPSFQGEATGIWSIGLGLRLR